MEKKFERRPPVRGKRDDKPVKERRTYSKRGSEGENERPLRTYTRRSEGENERPRRTYTRRSEGENERPRRTYTRRSEGENERPRRTYTRRSEGENERPRRTYTRRSEGENERPRRTYTRRSEGENERPRRTYTRRSEGDNQRARRTYTRRSEAPKPKVAAPKAKKENSDIVRLNKFIANSGVCSRREADTYIQTGLITVNGEVVTELGTKVNINDDIRFNGERLKGEKKVYVLMNKPKDYVTTLSDPHAEHTVMELISESKCKERIVPVGRLDKATTGVLLFTNDGDLTEKLTHPSYGVKKIYHAFLDKNLSKNDFEQILNGIVLEDGEIHADTLSYVDEDMSQVGLEIHSGRNRIVRRIFEHLGYKVKKLDRVFFAGLTKKNLRRGEWRFLTDQEIATLKMGSFN